MEKNEARVLAYKLAKEIDIKDLEEVSGGSANATVHGTAGPTGNTGNMDGNVDGKVDW